MLLGFFEQLRKYRVPVSIRELIDLLGLFEHRLLFADLEQFYFLSRLALVKNEKYYDRFDQAFAAYFDGIDHWQDLFEEQTGLPRVVLEQLAREMDWRELDRTLLEYQDNIAQRRDDEHLHRVDSHSDQNDGGDSAHHVENGSDSEEPVEPGNGDGGEGEGQEPGQGDGDSGDEGEDGEEGEGDGGEKGEGDEGKEGEGDDGERGEGLSEKAIAGERAKTSDTLLKKATKVWLEREFADLDPDVELGTRNLKMSLRRLRRWAREAAELELDLADTIHCTAANGGFLDIKMVPEKRNAVKVLMFFDVGGSMDEHIELCAQLFSAAKSEFRHLEFFYFHNCVYESVWSDNARRQEDRLPLWHVLQRYPGDYKVIFVGDADMGRHEIAERGGSVEHFNAEPGDVWLARIQEHFRQVVWLNPVNESRWRDSASISLIRRLLDDRMYFLSETGLSEAMKSLMR